MVILVTGGAGFIGSHLVERLLTDGHSVRVLDNLSTGSPLNLPPLGPSLSFVPGDIADPNVVRECVSGVDVIFHLAAVASVRASIEDPLTTHRTNLVGTITLLEAARSFGVPRFIYASSAAVYGNVEGLPVREEARLSPLSPYAADKLSSKHYLGFYARQYGVQGIAFRFFNVFGPRQDPSSPYSGVISIFAERALAGEPVTLFGDGLQSRDFVYVEDLVDILARCLDVPSRRLRIVNVGTGAERTLLDLVATLEELVGCPLERRFAPARAGDIRRSVAANQRLSELVGELSWLPFAEGLCRTLAAVAE